MNEVEKKASEMNELMEEVEVPASAFAPPTPDPPPEPPTPIETAKKRTRKTPTKQVPPRLSKLLPDAEKVQIWKRELGKRTHVNDYTARDLQHAPSIESFIKQYVMPVAGEGDYDIDLINNKGETVRTIPVSVMDPNKPPVGFDAKEHREGGMMQQVLDRTLDKLDRLEVESHKPQPSFVDRMKEMAEIRTMLAPPEEAKGNGSGGGDFMQMMMMMKMMDPPPQQSVSPELAAMRAELKAMKEMPSRDPLPPPLPMPLPAPDTTAADIVKEVVALTQKRDDMSLKDLVPLLKPEKSSMGATEIVAMVTSLAPVVMSVFGSKNDDKLQYLKDQIADLKRTPSRGIQDVLGDVGAVMKLAGALGGRNESETFWGFMNNLITQGPDLADSIGSIVDRVRTDDDDKKQLEPSRDTGGEKEPEKEPEGDALEFPPGFESIVKKITEAKDDAGRIGATLFAFQVLGKEKRWQKYLMRVISLTKKGDKDEVMEFLVSFLEALHERNMLSEETAKAAIEAFDKNFDKVVEELTKKTSP